MQARNFAHTQKGQTQNHYLSDAINKQGQNWANEDFQKTTKTEKKPIYVADMLKNNNRNMGSANDAYLQRMSEWTANHNAQVQQDTVNAQKQKELDNKAFGDVIKDRDIMELTTAEKELHNKGKLATTKKVGDMEYALVKTADGKRAVWAQMEDKNLQWKAKLAEAKARADEAIQAAKDRDRASFEKHMGELNKLMATKVNLLGKLTGIDIGVYDFETNGVARMVGDTEKLQDLAKQNADEIKNVIGEIKDLNDEFSRVRQANVLGILGYPQDTQLTAFTETFEGYRQEDEKFQADSNRTDFMSKAARTKSIE